MKKSMTLLHLTAAAGKFARLLSQERKYSPLRLTEHDDSFCNCDVDGLIMTLLLRVSEAFQSYGIGADDDFGIAAISEAMCGQVG